MFHQIKFLLPTLFLLYVFYRIFVYKMHDTSYVILCTHIVQYTKMNKDIIDIYFTYYNPSQLPIPVNLYTYSLYVITKPFPLNELVTYKI